MAEDVKVYSFHEFDPQKIARFLEQEYPADKARFINTYGAWGFRGNAGRFVAVQEPDTVIGYVATFPSAILIDGQSQPMTWGGDLLVGQHYRGYKHFRALDNQRDRFPLVCAFPNQLSTPLLKRSGWHVRQDGMRFILPLAPAGLSLILSTRLSARTFRKLRKASRRELLAHQIRQRMARAVIPISAAPYLAARRFRLARYRPATARQLANPDATLLADVFMRHMRPGSIITTYRDADYLRWRYLESPVADELAYYVAGSQDAPSHVVIARHATRRGARILRILDLFGDLDDHEGLRDALRLAIRDGARRGSAMVVVTAWLESLQGLLRSLNFAETETLTFVYYSHLNQALPERLHTATYHWSLGDGDTDYI